jgi:small basic protein
VQGDERHAQIVTCLWTGGVAVIAALGLVLGVIAGLLLRPDVPLWLVPYLPIAVVAALDAVFGALRALLDDVFNDRVFVVSFTSNVLIAAVLVFLGDQLGVGAQISTGVVVVLAMRIFANVAAIRRHLFHA